MTDSITKQDDKQNCTDDSINSIVENLKKEHQQELLYAKAEIENIRRRAGEDVSKASKYAIEKFSSEVIAIKDSLEAGLRTDIGTVEKFKEGLVLTLNQISQVFDKFGITEINPDGEIFDANKHQAISSINSDKPNNYIVSVLQKGYLLNDRLVRPALVTVSNGIQQPVNQSTNQS